MGIAAPVAGARILTSDLAAFYNLLKGVSGSGETITLIYNAAAALILQPSADPAANTEAIQIKNNAGTVQSSLTFDGKVKAADGTAAAPGLRFESEATGWALAAASTPILSIAGTEQLRLTATALTLAAAATRIVPGATSLSLRNNANNADNLILLDAGAATFRTTAAFGAATASRINRTGGNLTQTGVANLGTQLSFMGWVFVYNRSNGYGAIYAVNGGLHTTVEISDPATKFTGTKDSATSINIYWLTDHYEIQNNLGSGTIGYEVHILEVDV